MVWRPPEEIKESRRTVWRAVVVWGLLALQVAVVLGVTAAVKSANRVPLAESVAAGPLLVQLPEGWAANVDLKPPHIWGVDGKGELRLDVSLIQTREALGSPLEYLSHAYGSAPPGDVPRNVTIGGRPGVMVSFAARLPAMDMRQIVHATVAVAQVNPRTFLRVELRRTAHLDDPAANSADAVLVQQVAEHVRLADSPGGPGE